MHSLLVATAAAAVSSELAYYGCLVVAVIILGISKTGFGGGIGILSIPLMALVMPAERMIGVLAVLLVVVDILANLHYVGRYDWPILRWLIPGAIIGVLIGALVLVAMRRHDPADFNRNLTLVIGMICLLFVVAQCIRLIGTRLPTLPLGAASGLTIGTLAGGVSTISHSAGPIVSLYLLQERVSKERLIGTLVLYTLLINGVKLIGYTMIGTVTTASVREALWMMPLLPVGTVAGAWMSRRLPEKPFIVILYVAAAATAGQMIYAGLSR